MHLSINLGVDTLKSNDLDLYELNILAIIYSYERNEKPCLLRRDKMAEYLGLSVSSVQRYYASLKEKKYIFITRQTKKLTQKGLTFCQSYFAYRLTKRQKKEQRAPRWYAKYQAQLENEKQEQSKPEYSQEQLKQLASDIFGVEGD